MQQGKRQLSPAYKPRAWAMPMHRSRAKLKALCVHRRGGKGWFGHHEGLAAYMRRLAEPPEMMKVPKFHAWTVAPNFPQARQTEHELEQFIPVWGRPEVTWNDSSRGYNRADHTFTMVFPGGSGYWEVKSGHDPESLQTVGLDYLHVQECQDISEAAFNKLLPTLRDPGRLGLSVWEGIPPDDPNHWFARLLTWAGEQKEAVARALWLPYTENTELEDVVREDIERDREFMVEREWRRMYMAELPMGGGSFLGNVDGCIEGEAAIGGEEGKRYVMGVDVGKKVDFTVIIVMDAEARKVVWERRFGGMDWVVTEETIVAEAARFRCKRVLIDSTGVGDPVYDRLLYMGLPVYPFLFTNESKYRIMMDLALAIEKRTVSYPNIPPMLREMKALRAERLPSGRSRIEAAPGQHDDYPCALALALSLCDPPLEMRIVGPLGSSSYVTQADGGGVRPGSGPWMMRRRLLDKINARVEAVSEQEESMATTG